VSCFFFADINCENKNVCMEKLNGEQAKQLDPAIVLLLTYG
jgi:hypothetical protein